MNRNPIYFALFTAAVIAVSCVLVFGGHVTGGLAAVFGAIGVIRS